MVIDLPQAELIQTTMSLTQLTDKLKVGMDLLKEALEKQKVVV
jgi:hypothetical protein